MKSGEKRLGPGHDNAFFNFLKGCFMREILNMLSMNPEVSTKLIGEIIEK